MQIEIDRNNLVLFEENDYFGTLLSSYQLEYVTKYANNIMVQKLAYELLSFLAVKKLPVSPKNVAKGFGIETVTIRSLSYNERFKEVLYGMDGFSVFNTQMNTYKIVYDDTYIKRAAFTIAHEMGHIILGHFKDKRINEQTFEGKNIYAVSEVQANTFARHLLMPFPVLLYIKHKLAAKNMFSDNIFKNYIMRFCGTSEMAVKYALEQFYMWEKNVDECGMAVLEKKVFNNFKSFIDEYIF